MTRFPFHALATNEGKNARKHEPFLARWWFSCGCVLTCASIHPYNESYGDAFTCPGDRGPACRMLMAVFRHYIAIRTLITSRIDFAFGCHAVYVVLRIMTHSMCILNSTPALRSHDLRLSMMPFKCSPWFGLRRRCPAVRLTRVCIFHRGSWCLFLVRGAQMVSNAAFQTLVKRLMIQ